MTTPDPADLSQAQAEIAKLRTENTELKKELQRRRALPRTRSIDALKFSGSFLLPMLDRQKVFRTFVAFFDEASFYTLPKEDWPPRERVLERARDFGLAVLRFFVKRRIVFIMFSLLAFLMPLVQVWLVFQQNAIIENQNKYFNIQVYDIVARSLTGEDTTGKRITSALLAREDFGLINGIIRSVFEAEGSAAYTAEDAASNPLLFEETAARGHLVSAMALAIEKQSADIGDQILWDKTEDTVGLIAADASDRLPTLLRVRSSTAVGSPRIKQECFRYLFSLTQFMKRSMALSRASGHEDAFFKNVGPMISRMSRQRSAPDGVFRTAFVVAFSEFLIEVAQRPKLGDRPTDLDAATVERYLKEGFATLVARTQAAGYKVDQGQLKQLLEVP